MNVLTCKHNFRYVYHLTAGGFALVFPLDNMEKGAFDSQLSDIGSDGTKINLRATIYRCVISSSIFSIWSLSALFSCTSVEPVIHIFWMYQDSSFSSWKIFKSVISIKTKNLIIMIWIFSYRKDTSAIVSNCQCFTCQNHTRAYINHLLNVHEMLAQILLEM